MYHFTALVTCLAILLYFFTSIQVSKARSAFGIKVPATSGHPDFERVFRVQMNTLEWMPIFLPSLWLFAIYISDPIAAGLGLVWIAGRTLYMFEKDKRGRSFCAGAFASYWPPLLAHAKPTAGRGAKQVLLGVTRRADGTKQVTYAGHPLYRFVRDTMPGQTNGQDLHAFGAGWHVLSPAGKKVAK